MLTALDFANSLNSTPPVERFIYLGSNAKPVKAKNILRRNIVDRNVAQPRTLQVHARAVFLLCWS
jgi:hypothetical protein